MNELAMVMRWRYGNCWRVGLIQHLYRRIVTAHRARCAGCRRLPRPKWLGTNHRSTRSKR